MPLLRGLARTAAIAGTATAVSNRVSRRQANRWAEQDAAAVQQPAASEPQAAAPSSGEDDRIEKLKDLAELKAQGILSEDEFAAEKSRILAT